MCVWGGGGPRADVFVTVFPARRASKSSGSNVVVSWIGSDSGSGIDHYEVRLDGGASVRVASGITHTFVGVADGLHTVTAKAVDVVGNTHEETLTFRVNTNWVTGGGPFGSLPMIARILGILVVVLALLVWWMKKRASVQGPPPGGRPRVRFRPESGKGTTMGAYEELMPIR